ncbi:hypothetical protein K439DRAFT_1391479 [Ramaria rubella]|nr:hypothetical protein K439DRAFT_1391479 [Ramaria rubella]
MSLSLYPRGSPAPPPSAVGKQPRKGPCGGIVKRFSVPTSRPRSRTTPAEITTRSPLFFLPQYRRPTRLFMCCSLYKGPLLSTLSLLLVPVSTRAPDAPATRHAPMLLVEFSTDVKQLDEWSRRVGVALSVESLGAPYARAHRHLLAMKHALVAHHGFRDCPPSDPRVLFTVQCQPPHRSSAGVPRSPTIKLELPIHASSFFSPERRVQWQMVFHSAMWPSLRHSVQPVGDMLHLLQCLMPGLLLVVHIEDGWRTARGLPPADWININQQLLVDILGQSHFRRLNRAASDPKLAFMAAPAS